MAARRVVVVGSINVDMIVAAARLPGRGETVAGGTLTRSGGGKGANQAVAAARAGADVVLVGAVGDDDLGAGALAELAAEGVDVRAVARVADAATGVALIVVDEHGDNQIAVASGANHALDPDAVRAAVAPLLAGGGVVLTGFELPDAVVLAAAEAASGPLVVNPAPARALPDGLAEHRPILTPNEHEASALTGEDDPERAAAKLMEITQAPVVVTLGARGALLVTPDGTLATTLPAPRVEAVDTTGAGDVFSGVLALGLAAGTPLRDAVAQAVEAAARSVTTRGARGA